jgi:hypothetical protein
MNSFVRPRWAIGVGVVGMIIWFVYVSIWNLWWVRPIPWFDTLLIWVAVPAGVLGLVCLLVIYLLLKQSAGAPEFYQLFKRAIPVFMIGIVIMGMIAHPHYYTDSNFHIELTAYQERQIIRATGDLVSVAAESISDPVGVGVTDDSGLIDLPESSSSSSSDSDSDSGGEIWLILAVILAILYYLLVLVLALIWADFWLVAWFVYALGSIGVGLLDIADGEEL